VSDVVTETTGNLWFVLPRIVPPLGGVQRAAFLMMKHRGLIELVSGNDAPLLQADVRSQGQSLFENVEAERLADWIPVYRSSGAAHTATLTWLTPHDELGWAARLTVENRGTTPLPVEFAFTFHWGQTLVTTYCPEPLTGHLRPMASGWGDGGFGLGWATSRTEFGVGLGHSDGGRMQVRALRRRDHFEVWSGDARGDVPELLDTDVAAEVQALREAEVAPGETATFDLFMTAAQDTKAACMSTRYLYHRGFEDLLDTTIERLETLNAPLPAGLQADADLGPLVRRNRLFSYFYSLGRTLDTEELAPVTSRSSDYYVSAAYWDRDSLLWSFPTILDMDVERAAEMLETAFGRQGRNIGVHSRFIDGSIYETGFELDELCAPVLALERYIKRTHDWSLLQRIDLDRVIRRVQKELRQRRHADIALFSTEYLPTDDRAEMPYCIYDNALVWALGGALEYIEHYRENTTAAQGWAEVRRQVADAIREHGIIEHHGRAMVAWSVDLEGNYRLYDEPPGSVTLLGHLGFISHDDPALQATCDWIYSADNPLYFAQFDEIGCLHEPLPWVLAIANSLLLPRRREGALQRLRGLPMDDGLACEAVYEDSGRVKAGHHFATCAGYLCMAVREAFVAAEATSQPANDRATRS
jgi:hypothetical protein